MRTRVAAAAKVLAAETNRHLRLQLESQRLLAHGVYIPFLRWTPPTHQVKGTAGQTGWVEHKHDSDGSTSDSEGSDAAPVRDITRPTASTLAKRHDAPPDRANRRAGVMDGFRTLTPVVGDGDEGLRPGGHRATAGGRTGGGGHKGAPRARKTVPKAPIRPEAGSRRKPAARDTRATAAPSASEEAKASREPRGTGKRDEDEEAAMEGKCGGGDAVSDRRGWHGEETKYQTGAAVGARAGAGTAWLYEPAVRSIARADASPSGDVGVRGWGTARPRGRQEDEEAKPHRSRGRSAWG